MALYGLRLQIGPKGEQSSFILVALSKEEEEEEEEDKRKLDFQDGRQDESKREG